MILKNHIRTEILVFMPPFIIMDPFVIWIILMVIRLKHLLEVIVVFQIM